MFLFSNSPPHSTSSSCIQQLPYDKWWPLLTLGDLCWHLLTIVDLVTLRQFHNLAMFCKKAFLLGGSYCFSAINRACIRLPPYRPIQQPWQRGTYIELRIVYNTMHRLLGYYKEWLWPKASPRGHRPHSPPQELGRKGLWGPELLVVYIGCSIELTAL